jgi:S-(hydroxymethyl)glutathione dehydrogenase/alcohol dehydrogenase
MRAALLRTFNAPMSVEEVDLLDLAPDRVLIKTHASPFCSTDVVNWRGELGKIPPVILGHASIGEVVEVGTGVEGLRVGQRVVVPGTPECGTCYYCGIGRPDQCSELFDLGGIYPEVAKTAQGEPVPCSGCVGGYAEFMNISKNQAFPIESDLPSDVLSLLGCGITTGVGAVFNVAEVKPGESVAVVGLGHLGQWMVQAARLAGAATIIGVDPVAGRREVAGRLGATHLVDPEAEDAESVVKALTGGRGADTVLEAAGWPAAQRLSLLLSRRAGTVVYSGLLGLGKEVSLPQAALAVQSRRLVSTQNGNVRMRRDLQRYTELLERGLLDAAEIITGRYPLDEVNTALRKAEALENLTGVIVFDH